MSLISAVPIQAVVINCMEIIFLCNSDKSAIYAICVLRWRVHTSLWLITVGAIPCSHHARGLQIFIALLRALRFYLPRLLISKRFRSKIEDIIVEEKKKRPHLCTQIERFRLFRWSVVSHCDIHLQLMFKRGQIYFQAYL